MTKTDAQIARSDSNESIDAAVFDDLTADATIGGRTLVRPLARSRFGARYLARDPRRDTDCIVWLFDRVPLEQGPRLWGYLKKNAGRRRAHILTIEAAGRETTGCWAVTPYVGNHDGVVTLESLRAARGGVMSAFETGRAIEQLLDASVSAHAENEYHGSLDPACVLVNPRGTLEIGMYGLKATLEGTRPAEDAACDEIRSIGLIAERLLLGDAGDGTLSAPPTPDRLRAGSALRAWIRRACDPIEGFDSASEAVASLPDRHDDASERRLDAARLLLGKLSAVVSPGRAKPGVSEGSTTGRV